MKASRWCLVPLRIRLFQKRIGGAIAVAVLTGVAVSCQSVAALRHEAVALDRAPRVIESSVKAHLLDGSTVLFPDGVTITDDRVTGSGERYDIRLSPVGSVSTVARDSVIAVESFVPEIDSDRTLKYNLPHLGVAIVVGIVAGLSSR